MDTNKITVLCSKSDRIFENGKFAERMLDKIDNIRTIVIKSSYTDFVVRIEDYPELKSFAEKLIKYVVKSEQVKQAEIKTEIAKCL